MEKKLNEEKMKIEDIKKLNIYEKMSLITEEIGVVEKNLKVQVNQTNSYKAVSERDILDNVKPLEKKYRVYSYPVNRKIIENDILSKESEYNGKVTKTNIIYMRLEIVYRFVNIDNPSEYIDITTYGDGLDTGDKAPGKAMTYGDKYGLMKAYKISTGDDPDKEPSPQDGYTKEEKKASPKQIDMIESIYDDVEIEKIYTHFKINDLSELTIQQASGLISRKKERKLIWN